MRRVTLTHPAINGKRPDMSYPLEEMVRKLMSEPAYKVVKDDSDQCQNCSRGVMWDVVGPDDVALGTTYGDHGDAEYMADNMSDAFNMGVVLERARWHKWIARYGIAAYPDWIL